MDKENFSQPDLFSQAEGIYKDKEERGNLFSFLRVYEKAVILIILFIFTGAIFFSLGIAKGRKEVLAKFYRRSNLEQQALSVAAQMKEPVIPASHEEKFIPLLAQQAAGQPLANSAFTIQLASYKNKQTALREAENLNKKGYDSSVIVRGNYNILCVGNFSNKEQAKPILSELKRKYSDSYIIRRT